LPLKRILHAHKEKCVWFLNKITTTYKKPITEMLEVDATGEKLLKGTKQEQGRPERLRRISSIRWVRAK
jgi:hypothetical protein